MSILLNGQSNFCEDLITFTFCSNLPPSYKETTQQYLDNITDIKIYKLSDIITGILQEENHQKANTVVSVSLNKFSMVKNLGQNVPNVVKQTTAHETIGPGESIHKRARAERPKKHLVPERTKTKRHWKKGKRKRKG